jgi:hypothetical protein
MMAIKKYEYNWICAISYWYKIHCTRHNYAQAMGKELACLSVCWCYDSYIEDYYICILTKPLNCLR